MIDMSFSGIMAGTIFGTLGFWIISQARKKGNIQLAVVGAVLLLYPFFVTGPIALWGLGILLCSLARRLW